MLLIIAQPLFWILGALLIKRCLPTSGLLSPMFPHWYAAWFLGLVLNVMVDFALNQFLQVLLTPLIVCVVATLLALIVALSLKRPESTSTIATESYDNWTIATAAMASLIAGPLVTAHALMLWTPLSDFDTFSYHLPFARLIGEGNFPNDINTSILGLTATHPPTLFAVYGWNPFFQFQQSMLAVPKMTVIAINTLTLSTTFFIARHRLHCGIPATLVTVACLALPLNRVPNTQCLTTLYCTLALYYSWTWMNEDVREKPFRSYLIGTLFWVGCYWANFTGLMISGLFMAGVFLSILPSKWKTNRPIIYPRFFFYISLIVLLSAAIHLIRNWIVSGNPVYPGLLNVFGGKGMTGWFLETIWLPSAKSMDWSNLREAYGYAQPLTALMLAGTVSVLHLRKDTQYPRFLSGFILVCYGVAWIKLLPWGWVPTWRYLFPILPLSLLAIAAQIDEFTQRPTLRGCAGFIHFVVIAVWMMNPNVGATEFYVCLGVVCLGTPLIAALLARKERTTRRWPAIFFGVLAMAIFITGLGNRLSIHRIFWPAIGLPMLIFVAVIVVVLTINRLRKSGPSSAPIHRAWVAVIILVITITGFAREANWKSINDYSLPIKKDIEWMNWHLPPNATVLTLDPRLFTLDRSYVQATDSRFESCYSTNTARACFARLKEFDISHVYLSEFSAHTPFVTPFKRLMWPDNNPYIELVYRRENSWIVQILWDRVPLQKLPAQE